MSLCRRPGEPGPMRAMEEAGASARRCLSRGGARGSRAVLGFARGRDRGKTRPPPNFGKRKKYGPAASAAETGARFVMKRKKRKITPSLLALSVLPLLAFGLIVSLITSRLIYTSLRDEVEYSLNVLIHNAYAIGQLLYPGEYSERDGELYKGGQPLAGRFEIVDEMQASAGVDATLFYGDERYLTTIRTPDGARASGTPAQPEVVQRVLRDGEDFFSDRVLVNGVPYFGYYMPLTKADGTAVGMLFVGRPRAQVMKSIDRNILQVCLSEAGILAIAVGLAIYYSRKMVYSLNKTEKFLGEIASGDLTAHIDPYLLERQDEVGEMGRFAVVLQRSIEDLVGKDPLTGLYNRRSCDVVLQSLAERAQRDGRPFTVVMGDIDYFKKVNDDYGHQAGDAVLKAVAETLSAHMERRGFVFRWGGEEFLLLYEEMDEKAALLRLKRLQGELARAKVEWQGTPIRVTMTFGVADSTHSPQPEALIRLADENLYLGKQEGRDRVVSAREEREL